MGLSRRANRRLTAALLAIPITVAFGLLLFTWWAEQRLFRISSPALVEVSQRTVLQFPPSARLVGSRFQELPWQELLARVDMDRPDVKQFMASGHLAGRWTRDEDVVRMFPTTDFERLPDMPWWDPNREMEAFWVVRAPPAGLPEGANGHLLVLIDVDDPTSAVVYVYQIRG